MKPAKTHRLQQARDLGLLRRQRLAAEDREHYRTEEAAFAAWARQSQDDDGYAYFMSMRGPHYEGPNAEDRWIRQRDEQANELRYGGYLVPYDLPGDGEVTLPKFYDHDEQEKEAEYGRYLEFKQYRRHYARHYGLTWGINRRRVKESGWQPQPPRPPHLPWDKDDDDLPF